MHEEPDVRVKTLEEPDFRHAQGAGHLLQQPELVRARLGFVFGLRTLILLCLT